MSNDNYNKTTDEILGSVVQKNEQIKDIMCERDYWMYQLEKKLKQEFTGQCPVNNITDKLPTMEEALKLRETMNEIKKIYDWEYDGDEGFIDSVKEREEVFKKYYDVFKAEQHWEKEYHELKKKVDWGSIEKYSDRIDELIEKNNTQRATLDKLGLALDAHCAELEVVNQNWAHDNEVNKEIIEDLEARLKDKPKRLSPKDKDLLKEVWVAPNGSEDLKKLIKRLIK